jgi:hypothetical protein
MDLSAIIFAFIVGLVLILYAAFERRITSWQAHRFFKKMLKTGSWKNQSPKESNFTIRFDFDGLSVLSKKDQATISLMKWSEVRKVIAFKRDLFVVDLICLVFVGDTNGMEIHEEMEGWKEVSDSLPTFLAGCQPIHDWFHSVAFPAFATNEVVIFDKSNIRATR